MVFTKFKEKYQKREVREYPHKVIPTPLVSVIVQTYQHKNYIKDCLDAILKQETNFPFEIILGEDFSSDGTREICIDYAKKYAGKIRLFLHQPENKIKVLEITTGNFNALYNFYSANGKYIAFCEGDDLWRDSLKLQKQVDVLKENSDLVFTYHSFQEVNEKEEPIEKNSILEQPAQNISREDLKKLTFHPLLSTMCFRKFENKLPEEMAEVINVDSFLISLLGNYGAAGFLRDIKPSYYRRHPGGMWSGQIKQLKFQSKLLTYQRLCSFYAKIKEYQIAQSFEDNYRKILRQLIFSYLKQGKVILLFKILIRGL